MVLICQYDWGLIHWPPEFSFGPFSLPLVLTYRTPLSGQPAAVRGSLVRVYRWIPRKKRRYGHKKPPPILRGCADPVTRAPPCKGDDIFKIFIFTLGLIFFSVLSVCLQICMQWGQVGKEQTLSSSVSFYIDCLEKVWPRFRVGLFPSDEPVKKILCRYAPLLGC